MNLKAGPSDSNLGWNFTSFSGKATVSTDSGKRVSGSVVSIDEISFAQITSIQGKLTLGFNGRYGQWTFEENGGAVVVPYTVSPEKVLYVAGGYELRPLINGGEFMFAPPGGFGLSQENPEVTAKRETLEETGIKLNNLTLVGYCTPNRAFWVKQTNGNWPITIYASYIDWTKLDHQSEGAALFQIMNHQVELDKLTELIFVEVIEAINMTNDGIAITAYAKTLAAWQEGKLNHL